MNEWCQMQPQSKMVFHIPKMKYNIFFSFIIPFDFHYLFFVFPFFHIHWEFFLRRQTLSSPSSVITIFKIDLVNLMNTINELFSPSVIISTMRYIDIIGIVF